MLALFQANIQEKRRKMDSLERYKMLSKEDKAIYIIHIRAFKDILRAIKKRKYKKRF